MGFKQTDRVIGRRSQSRLRVRLPARLITLCGTQSAILADLSMGGARVLAERDLRRGAEGVLQWGNFEAFGEVSWAADGMFGMRFHDFLSPRIVVATRDLDACERIGSDREIARETVREWVEGKRRL